MDLFASLLVWVLLGVVITGCYWFVRHAGDAADARRREAKRQDYEARQQQRDQRLILRDLEACVPALVPRWRELVDDGCDPAEAWHRSVEETPGVVIGTTYGIPALLAESERRRHLYVIGKTGSGKTSLLLHLIKADLDAGRGVGVIAPEAELFRDWLLPMIPKERAHEVIYFAPGNPKNPVTFNPLFLEDHGQQGRAAEELFSIFKRALGEEEFGARMTPILGSAFACLTGRPEATLWDVKRMLEDPAFRKDVLAGVSDDYLRDFWQNTFPQYPKGAHLPIVNRLDQFLRPMQVRRALCHPTSSFSIRRALDERQILLFDLSGLAPDSMLLLGQMLLSKFQLELMRREELTQEERAPFYLYADEFQAFAGVSEGTWRELLSRGRRYGLALTLAHQYPSQLPEGLRDEIFGNVASLIAFALSAKDAQVVRKELLEFPFDGGTSRPLPIEAFVTLRTGQAVARLGGGAYAIPLQTAEPPTSPPPWRGEEVKAVSWERYGVSALPGPPRKVPDPKRTPPPRKADDFLE